MALLCMHFFTSKNISKSWKLNHNAPKILYKKKVARCTIGMHIVSSFQNIGVNFWKVMSCRVCICICRNVEDGPAYHYIKPQIIFPFPAPIVIWIGQWNTSRRTTEFSCGAILILGMTSSASESPRLKEIGGLRFPALQWIQKMQTNLWCGEVCFFFILQIRGWWNF